MNFSFADIGKQLQEGVERAKVEASKLGDMVDEGLDKLDSATESTWNEVSSNLAAATRDDDVDEGGSASAFVGAAAAASADAEEVEALRASLRQARVEIERLDKQVSDAREEAEEARNDAKRFAMQAVRAASKPAGAGDGPAPAPGGAGDDTGAGDPAAEEKLRRIEAKADRTAAAAAAADARASMPEQLPDAAAAVFAKAASAVADAEGDDPENGASAAMDDDLPDYEEPDILA